ncbi:MAG: bifunctional UDP-N-acetylglucosamine diphosphorylase/glucosamine-1-phosphate N-acetyltransferase GlmU [Acholeplasmatales bacterium]|nr:bifunctional UDP-N-acetylglucosamine diphosphorylase/glucosamine-1-phosphate N-acetyltransferase GlmU [Acholeplasmatales bacterium]
MINAIILAAGKGERMKSDVPKCAFPILKKPMINYILDTLKKTKVDNRVIVVGHKKEVFFEMLKDEEFAIQENQLGTADAVKCAISKLKDGITIVLPGDTPLISNLLINKLLDLQLKDNNDMTLCTMIVENPFGYGRIIRENNKIKHIVEEKEATKEIKEIKEVNTGIMVFNNEFLKKAIKKIDNNNSKGEYYLTDIINFAKDISSYTLDDPNMLMGINDLNALNIIEEKLEKEIKKNLINSGVYIINKDSVTIGPDVEIAPGVTIYPNSFIMGKTKIEKNAIIGPSTELYNATINENVLCRQSVVYDSTILKDATVGPFAHIRMNTIVGEKDRIGNFVEVKNSILGVNTKASHLSYLGDSEIGNNVNIGCGSITVNYDGKKKSKTIIGNNVFVGCNSNLIAPITIEDDSFIAAGSTITDNVEKEDLAIARSKQINKKGYARKYK